MAAANDIEGPFFLAENSFGVSSQRDQPIRRNIQGRRITTKRVSQYNNQNELTLIANYNSIDEAFQATGTDKGSIIKVCKDKQKTAGGFYWRYTDETVNEAIDLSSFVPITDYPKYMVNNKGDVYSLTTKQIMKISPDKYGLGHIKISNKIQDTINGIVTEKNNNKDFLIHYLVASHFVPNDEPINKTAVRHIDGDKSNNHHTNLYWTTMEEAQRVSLIGRRVNNLLVTELI